MSEMTAAVILEHLVTLAHSLGDPARDLVILAEGSVSAQLDAETFLVKASGKELHAAEKNDFVPMHLRRLVDALDGVLLSDEKRQELLNACKTDPQSTQVPSMESFLHAYLLSLPHVEYVGHTHPTPVLSVLCSRHAFAAVQGRLCPEEIVCCGPAVVYVEYADPGMPLARLLRERVETFIEDHNMPPRIILMENHGMIATGRTPREVEIATAMYVKMAQVILGTYPLGGPRFLTREQVARIHTRPDEHYRQRLIGGE